MTRGTLGTLTVNGDDVQNKIRSPLGGWPAHDIMFSTGRPDRRLDHHAFEVNSQSLPPTHSFTRAENADPLSVSSRAAGATIVPSCDFRMMDANGQVVHPRRNFEYGHCPGDRSRGAGVMSEEWGRPRFCPFGPEQSAGGAQNVGTGDVGFFSCARTDKIFSDHE